MPRNKVQFQKGLSEARFRELYGSEEQCREALFRWRWPQGFSCPRCGATRHCEIAGRKLYQCAACRHQVSLTAGTLFHATKLALTLWFSAIYHMTQSKKGISSIELGRRLGVTQTTAWKIKQKLMLAVVPGCAYMVLFLIGRWRLADGMLLGLADFVSRCGYSVEGPVIDLERLAGAVAHDGAVRRRGRA